MGEAWAVGTIGLLGRLNLSTTPVPSSFGFSLHDLLKKLLSLRKPPPGKYEILDFLEFRGPIARSAAPTRVEGEAGLEQESNLLPLFHIGLLRCLEVLTHVGHEFPALRARNFPSCPFRRA